MQKLKSTESDRLLVQIQAYLDNMFDVGALLEDAETKNTLLEHLDELQEHNTQVEHTHTRARADTHARTHTNKRWHLCLFQLSSRLQESEREAVEKVSELETKLIQATKEAELLKVEVKLD